MPVTDNLSRNFTYHIYRPGHSKIFIGRILLPRPPDGSGNAGHFGYNCRVSGTGEMPG